MPRAAVLESFKSPLQVRDYPLPPSLDPGAALVRTQMAGICGTDVHLWKGELPIQLPVILGHETVGVIEQLSPELTQDWSGAIESWRPRHMDFHRLVRQVFLLRGEKTTDSVSASPRLWNRLQE